MNEGSILIRHEQCPKCAREGHDRAKNNLGVYDDGHSYCFRCKFYSRGSGYGAKYTSNHSNTNDRTINMKKQQVVLPEDCTNEYPQIAIDWMGEYELDTVDMKNNKCLWSPSNNRLIFPIYDEKELVAHVGRYISDTARPPTIPKWLSHGNLKKHLHILNRDGAEEGLVIVEDIISAIKISKVTASMPVFGCVIGLDRWKVLRTLCDDDLKIHVWLDPDMEVQVMKESLLGQQIGLKAKTVFSGHDPKYYTTDEITQILRKGLLKEPYSKTSTSVIGLEYEEANILAGVGNPKPYIP
jgi:hypothetical protein